MRLGRKGTTIAIASLGLAGALAGGMGIAQAASGPTSATTTATTVAATTNPSTGPYGHGMGYGMGMGMGYGMRGTGDWQDSPMAAAASYLGLSQTDLMTQMRSGKTLADIAKAKGKTVSGLESAMLAALKTNIEANSNLTAAQKSALLAQASSRIDAMVNRTCPAGTGSGGAGYGPMRGMMGGTQG